MTKRVLGIPWLFAVAYTAVGFSIYFALGIVADFGLGLTPLVFLAAGLLFALTIMVYSEGTAMFVERGGSTTLARHAFNELISFTAGWAILIDYVIVIAVAAITVPHYLGPISGSLADSSGEVITAAVVIVIVVALNILGVTGRHRQPVLVVLALADLTLQLAVIGVGAVVAFEPSLLTAELDLFGSPSFRDLVYGIVIATIAFAGIEAASDLAPDLDWEPHELRRVIATGALVVPLVYAAMAAVALMVVPVTAGPGGPESELAGEFIDDPILGVVAGFEPQWLADGMKWAVVVIAPVVLIWAASTAMLGLSRHVYVLATNRQIPSWLGQLNSRYTTPHVAILIAGLAAVGLVIPGDVVLLAGVYAFGALLAIAIGDLSVIRLRMTQPDRDRPYRMPLDVRFRGHAIPAVAVIAFVLTALLWVSVLLYHQPAAYVGAAWMVFGLGGYVVYRLVFEGTTLTQRVSVPAEALWKREPDVEFASVLVPVFGTELDDDIVGTAGRLAAAGGPDDPGGVGALLVAIHVVELPLTVPLDAPPPPDKLEKAEAALERAQEVAEEYEAVEVRTELVPARNVGQGIVEAARRLDVEAIVMGGEPPSRVRGGAVLGGIGASRPPEIGVVTEYVLRKSPARVLITAPPES